MKRIGLLGGTSWPSTIEYYKLLNEKADCHLGCGHSANITLWSIDFFKIKQLFSDRWEEINTIMEDEILSLNHTNPDCILICNNTLHQSYDLIKNRLSIDVPVFHMVDLSVKKAIDLGVKKVLLLGSKFTMNNSYYPSKFIKAGIQVVTPTAKEKDRIQSIQTNLAGGKCSSLYKSEMNEIITRYESCDALLLACTELSMVVTPLPNTIVLDPMAIQCDEAFKFSMIETI